MTTPTNQISNWYTNQVITATQMNAFSQDLYQKLTAITEAPLSAGQGVILSLGAVTQAGGANTSITVGAGSFRFPDTTAYNSYWLYQTGIYGNADSAVVGSISGNGFIVARYVFSPASVGVTNYTTAVTYMFVASVNTTTDCLIATVTSGTLVFPTGNYLINTAASNAQALAATATDVALTPSNLPSIILASETVNSGPLSLFWDKNGRTVQVTFTADSPVSSSSNFTILASTILAFLSGVSSFTNITKISACVSDVTISNADSTFSVSFNTASTTQVIVSFVSAGAGTTPVLNGYATWVWEY